MLNCFKSLKLQIRFLLQKCFSAGIRSCDPYLLQLLLQIDKKFPCVLLASCSCTERRNCRIRNCM